MTADFTASESPHTVPYKEEWVHCEQLKCKFWPYINLDHIDCTQLDTKWFCANPGNNSQSIVRSSSCLSLMAHLPRCFDKSGLGRRWLPLVDFRVNMDSMSHLPMLCPMFSFNLFLNEFWGILLEVFFARNLHFHFLFCFTNYSQQTQHSSSPLAVNFSGNPHSRAGYAIQRWLQARWGYGYNYGGGLEHDGLLRSLLWRLLQGSSLWPSPTSKVSRPIVKHFQVDEKTFQQVVASPPVLGKLAPDPN